MMPDIFTTEELGWRSPFFQVAFIHDGIKYQCVDVRRDPDTDAITVAEYQGEHGELVTVVRALPKKENS